MELQPVEKRVAVAAINKTYEDYTKPDGLRDREQKHNKAEETCAQHIYGLAVFASNRRGTVKEAASLFGALCLHAEKRIKQAGEITNVKDALPVWSVYKSNILRGMKIDLDPVDYRSEGAFRHATHEALQNRGPRLVGGVTGAGQKIVDTSAAGTPSQRRVNYQEATEWLNFTTVHPRLKEHMARLLVGAEYLGEGHEEAAEKVIAEAVDALSKLVDRRRVRDEIDREALRPAA